MYVHIPNKNGHNFFLFESTPYDCANAVYAYLCSEISQCSQMLVLTVVSDRGRVYPAHRASGVLSEDNYQSGITQSH